MTRVITIDREYGSGGGAIAAQLAAQRGWFLWDQNLTAEIAKYAKCDRFAVACREEKKDSLYYRLLKSFIRGGFEGSLSAQPILEVVDSDSLMEITQKVVRNAAADGNCVIVGRGSAYFLQDISDVFHVFVYSTKQDKLRRLRRTGKSATEALHLIDTIDRERAAFIKHYHGRCWPDRSLFHLMLNAAAGEDAAVQIINGAVAVYEASHVDKAAATEAGTTNCAPL